MRTHPVQLFLQACVLGTQLGLLQPHALDLLASQPTLVVVLLLLLVVVDAVAVAAAAPSRTLSALLLLLLVRPRRGLAHTVDRCGGGLHLSP